MNRIAIAALALFAAAPAWARNEPVDLPGDLRAFCSQGGEIAKKDGAKGTGNSVLSFKNEKRRFVALPGGQRLLAQERDGQDELLVEEGGKYRRIVGGYGKIFHLLASPDGKKVAVVIVQHFPDSFVESPAASMYVFDTKTWVGEQIVKIFGYSGLAWSPDSRVLAYGDAARVKLFDTLDKHVVETCGVDSASTPDDKERITNIGWLGDAALRFDYNNARGKLGYVVKLP